MPERTKEELHAKFISGVGMKKRSIKRKWMEIASITNKHSLLLLPYHSMLNHVEKLVEERRSYFLEKPNEKVKDFEKIRTCIVVD